MRGSEGDFPCDFHENTEVVVTRFRVSWVLGEQLHEVHCLTALRVLVVPSSSQCTYRTNPLGDSGHGTGLHATSLVLKTNSTASPGSGLSSSSAPRTLLTLKPVSPKNAASGTVSQVRCGPSTLATLCSC